MKNKQLVTLFAEAKNPSIASARDARSLLAPILTITTKIQKQAAHYRHLLVIAEGDPTHDAFLDSSLEELHLSIGSLEIDAKQLFEVGRRIGATNAQIERYFAEIGAEIERHDATVYTASKDGAATDIAVS